MFLAFNCLIDSHNVSVPKTVFFVPKVCCWLYGVWLGCGLSWFVGPKFSLCDGLGWIEETGPMDNSAVKTTYL